MSTRSTIAFHNEQTDRVEQIYCHFDGYTSGVGAMLMEHYNDAESAASILKEGDLSQLNSTVESSVYYRRDRGDKWCYVRPDRFDSFEHYDVEAQRQQYNYLFTQGEWHVRTGRGFVPLRSRSMS